MMDRRASEEAGRTVPVAVEPRGAAPLGPSLDSVVAAVHEVSSLPTVALNVMAIASDPESGAQDLRMAVEADVALTTRVIRCVNSAAFGLRNPVEHLGQAVTYLGFNQIRDLAVTATVATLLRGGRRVHTYDRNGLWRHLVAVGVAARMIARRTKVSGAESAYLAGLLHDLGILLFDANANPEFRRVITSLGSSKSLVEREREVVPWDHTELGARIGEVWRLPPTVVAAIRHHHAPEACDKAHAPIVHCVALANLLCTRKEISSVGLPLVGLSPGSLAALGLAKHDLAAMAEELDRELEAHQPLFDIQQGG